MTELDFNDPFIKRQFTDFVKEKERKRDELQKYILPWWDTGSPECEGEVTELLVGLISEYLDGLEYYLPKVFYVALEADELDINENPLCLAEKIFGLFETLRDEVKEEN